MKVNPESTPEAMLLKAASFVLLMITVVEIVVIKLGTAVKEVLKQVLGPV